MKILKIEEAERQFGKYISCDNKKCYIDDLSLQQIKIIPKPKIKIRDKKLTRKFSIYIRETEKELSRLKTLEQLFIDLLTTTQSE